MEDDRLTSTDITRMLGITPELWRQWRHRGKAPQPDGHHDRRTPYWLRSTIETWQANGSMTTAWSTENLITLPDLIDGDMLLLDRQAIEWYGQRITTIRELYRVTPDGDLITENGAIYAKPTPNNSKIWR